MDDPDYADLVQDYMAVLNGICNPESTDRRAKDDQNELVERFGGRDAALNTGTPGATPVPGQGHE